MSLRRHGPAVIQTSALAELLCPVSALGARAGQGPKATVNRRPFLARTVLCTARDTWGSLCLLSVTNVLDKGTMVTSTTPADRRNYTKIFRRYKKYICIVLTWIYFQWLMVWTGSTGQRASSLLQTALTKTDIARYILNHDAGWGFCWISGWCQSRTDVKCYEKSMSWRRHKTVKQSIACMEAILSLLWPMFWTRL